jgi:hypothetical protein
MYCKGKRKSSPGAFSGGEYEFNKLVTLGPKIFRDFALNLWNENNLEFER